MLSALGQYAISIRNLFGTHEEVSSSQRSVSEREGGLSNASSSETVVAVNLGMGGDEGNTYEVENVEKVANAIVSEKILWSSSSLKQSFISCYWDFVSCVFIFYILAKLDDIFTGIVTCCHS